MPKKSKGFGQSSQEGKLAKLFGDESVFWRVPNDQLVVIESDWDERKQRIGEIIGVDDENELLVVNDETLNIYGDFLKNNLESPSYLTGSEDFSWEEAYIFGYMSEEEHNKRRKKQASFLDTFKVLELAVDINLYSELHVKVQRMEDGKFFVLCLSWLEPTDRNSKNYQLLKDYAAWFWNYR